MIDVTYEYKPGDKAIIAHAPSGQLTWWDDYGKPVLFVVGAVIEIVGRSSLEDCWRFRHPRLGPASRNVEARSILPAGPGAVVEGMGTSHTLELTPRGKSTVGGLDEFLASLARGTVMDDFRVMEVDRVTGERKEVGQP